MCAVDCGVAINPDVIRAQMEGGIGYALAAALYRADQIEGDAVVCTISGGNVDAAMFARALETL